VHARTNIHGKSNRFYWLTASNDTPLRMIQFFLTAPFESRQIWDGGCGQNLG
jgi:hypothetical protein